MTNEAVKLVQGVYPARRYNCGSGDVFTKGQLLFLAGDYTASGSSLAVGTPFAGICAEDKAATDTKTSIGAWIDGIFDLTLAAGAACVNGNLVTMSGANLIRQAIATDTLSGAVVGKALETGSSGEVIKVAISVV